MTEETNSALFDTVEKFQERVNEIKSAYWKAQNLASAEQDRFLELVRTLKPTGNAETDDELSDLVNDVVYEFGLEAQDSFNIEDAEDFEAWEPSTC